MSDIQYDLSGALAELSGGKQGQPSTQGSARSTGPASIDAALAAEGVTGREADFVKSLYQQESSSGLNTKTSNAGAVGPMQVMPATFKGVADPGWDISNPEHNMRAGIRYAIEGYRKSGGNPVLAGAYYYGGPGGMEKAKQGIPVSDPRNPNAPNTIQYGQQVASRLSNPSASTPIVEVEPNKPIQVAPREKAQSDWVDSAGAFLSQPAPPEPKRNAFAYLNDSVIDVANAAAGLVKSGVDLFAPDSDVSKFIQEQIIESGQNSQSDWKKLQRSKLQAELESAGINDGSTYGEVAAEARKAGVQLQHALMSDPLGTISEAAGNLGPFAVLGRGMQAMKLANATKTAITAGVSGGLSTGEVRGNIWQKINGMKDAELQEASPAYKSLRQQGVSEQEAKAAVGANISNNIPELALTGLVGALSGKFGPEAMVTGVAPKYNMGRLGAAALGFMDEGPLQGGVEQVASNIGVQRAIPSQSLLEDVGQNIVAEGMPGAMMGGAFHSGARKAEMPPELKAVADAAASGGVASKAALAGAESGMNAAAAQPQPEADPISDRIAEVERFVSQNGVLNTLRSIGQPNGATAKEFLEALAVAKNPNADFLHRQLALESVEEGLRWAQSGTMPGLSNERGLATAQQPAQPGTSLATQQGGAVSTQGPSQFFDPNTVDVDATRVDNMIGGPRAIEGPRQGIGFDGRQSQAEQQAGQPTVNESLTVAPSALQKQSQPVQDASATNRQQTVDEAAQGMPRVQIPSVSAADVGEAATAARRKRKAQIQQLVQAGYETVSRDGQKFILSNTKTGQQVVLDSPADAQIARAAIGDMVNQRAHTAAASPLNDRLEPTPAQIAAGNYKKSDVIDLNGMKIKIENPAGSVRRGVGADGKAWETKMAHHYGEFVGTEGADGDRLDVFIGPRPDSNKVYVIDQKNKDGSFDEHKVVFGALNEQQARDTYLANYEPGWQGLGAITEMSLDDFKSWAKSDRAKEPLMYGKEGKVFQVNDGGVPFNLMALDTSELGSASRGGKGKVISKKDADLIKSIGAIFGVNVQFFRPVTSGFNGDGFFGGGNTLFLNERTTITPLAVFGHELMHLIKERNAKAYESMAKVVAANVKDPKSYRENYYGKEYAEENGSTPLTESELEELVSDVNGDLMLRPDFWRDVFRQVEADHKGEAKSIIAQLGAMLNNAIETIINGLKGGGFNAGQFVNNAKQIREAYKNGLAEYLKTSQVGRMAQQAENLKAQQKTSKDIKRSSAKIGNTITVDGKERPSLNSNGQRIAETDESLRNFWRWFGDSKVVDADGRPLVVYRGEGSGGERNTYSLSDTKENGIFMTPVKDVAMIYERGGEPRHFYVKADRLLDLTRDTKSTRKFISDWASYYDEWVDRASGEEMDASDIVLSGSLFDYEGDWSGERWKSLQEESLADHDAVYLPDYDRSIGMFPSLVVGSGASIKSATGNNGQFDPANPDIRKSTERPTDGLTVEAYHFSKEARPTLTTGAYGSGLQGSDRDEILGAKDQRLKQRLYFYVNKGTGVRPESGVGGIAHKATLDGIYDADADTKRLKQGKSKREFESAVLDAGYKGYLSRLEGSQPGQVILLGSQTVQPEVLGGRTQIPEAKVVPAPAQRDMDLGDKIMANKQLPAGQMDLPMWSRMFMALMPDAHAELNEAGFFSGDEGKKFYKDELVARLRKAQPEIKKSTARAKQEYEEVEAKYKGTAEDYINKRLLALGPDKSKAHGSLANAEYLSDIGITPSLLSEGRSLFNRPGLSLSPVDTMLMKSLWSNAKAFSNVLNLLSAGGEKSGQIDIKSRELMQGAVIIAAQDGEIRRAIVEAIPVDVMNLLSRKKISPQYLLGDYSVFKDSLFPDGDSSVSVLSDVALVGLMSDPAVKGAKIIAGSLDLARLSKEMLTAIGTGYFDGRPSLSASTVSIYGGVGEFHKFDSGNKELANFTRKQLYALQDNQWMKAPNGEPSSLNERQWVQVRTPSFQKWFGPWLEYAEKGKSVWEDDKVSKVVDSNGEPLVVYHGTDNGGFAEFNEPSGSRRGDLGIFTSDSWDMARSYVRKNRVQDIKLPDASLDRAGLEAAGFEFNEIDGGIELLAPNGFQLDGKYENDFVIQNETEAIAVANEYLEANQDNVGNQPGVYALFLNIKNPNEDNFEGAMWNGQREDQYQVLDEDGEQVYNENGRGYFDRETANRLAEERPGSEVVEADSHHQTTDDVVKDAWRYGNDGAIIHEVVDDGGGPSAYAFEPSTVYVALKPEQVKSADFNGGEFNPESRDIRKTSIRTGRSEEVGEWTVRVQKDGSLVVPGDIEKIRAAVPEDVKGRVIKGGIAFSHSDAPRVRAALGGNKVAYSRAGKVIDKLPMRNGVYVGAPEKYNKPGNIGRLRKILMDLAQEGAPGRFWYERSSEEVLRMTGGDVQEARKFVALLAIYSPQANVDANSTFALRAWAQYKAGQPISVKTGVMDKKAQAALDDVDAFWSGEKTGNFFFNLLRMIDPATADEQGVTGDMWMARAFQYQDDVIPSGSPKYAFVENETNRIAAELGWEPQQVQAAIWVAMKARMENAGVKQRTEASSEKRGWIRFDREVDEETGKTKKVRKILDEQKHRDNWLKEAFALDVSSDDTAQAKFDFADGVLRHIGQVSWEPRPSTKLPILQGIHSAPYEQQVEFQQAVQKVLYSEDGADLLAQKLGLLVDGVTPAPGIWESDVSAGAQSRVAMAPAAAGFMVRDKQEWKKLTIKEADKLFPDWKTNARFEKIPSVDPAQERLLDVYAATLGFLLRQDGVGYHRPFYSGLKSQENGVELRIGRPFTPEEAKLLWTLIDSSMKAEGNPDWEQAAGMISSPDGMRVVNFGAMEDNRAFRDLVEDAAESLPSSTEIKSVHFASDGNLVLNDWKANENGEDYLKTISEAGRQDVLDWAADVLAPRVQKVFEDFADRYNWGDPGRIPEIRSTEENQGQSVTKERISALEELMSCLRK